MMTSATFSTSIEAQQAAILLEGYHFELGCHDARQWVSLWLESYRPSWIRDAVIESLYQGRYKSVSVRQMLDLWQRRGQPIRHATHDFEAAVCREFGEVRLAPVSPDKLPERKQPRSIAKPRIGQDGQSSGQSSGQLSGQLSGSFDGLSDDQYGYSSDGSTSDRENPRYRHKPKAAVSFNLSSLPPASPGMAARGEAVMGQRESSVSQTRKTSAQNSEDTPKVEIRDNRDWREFPGYTTPAYSASSSDEVLQAQRQFNGVLYSSARAIQPFKPALPFSAQTLRLARQKAIALMHEAQQADQSAAQSSIQSSYQDAALGDTQRESRLAELKR